MGQVRLATTPELTAAELDEIRALCDAAFHGDFGDDDWDHTLGGHHAVVADGDRIVAHAAVVERILTAGDRDLRTGYVEGVATAPARQGEGLGTMAMAAANEVIRAGYGFGALGTDAYGFYEALGWERWRGETWVRTPGGLRRTPDDDDGMMVLRFGPSAGVDLAARLVCDERPGDDW